MTATPQISAAQLDRDAVDAFGALLKEKLARARAKGRGGWHNKNECTADALSAMLREHIDKGDPLDVAAFAMFLVMRGESITAGAGPCLEFDLAEATALVEYFEGEDANVAVQRAPDGLRAWCADYPDEGSVLLGSVDA